MLQHIKLLIYYLFACHETMFIFLNNVMCLLPKATNLIMKCFIYRKPLIYYLCVFHETMFIFLNNVMCLLPKTINLIMKCFIYYLCALHETMSILCAFDETISIFFNIVFITYNKHSFLEMYEKLLIYYLCKFHKAMPIKVYLFE